MKPEIRRFPVQHPLLKKHIKFFWELHIDHIQLNHKLIPQRTINLRINLSETPHQVFIDNTTHRLEDIYFLGIQDHFKDANLKIDGKVDMLGVCFYPDGFYPFINIPLGEFKNQLLGARQAGFKLTTTLCEQLKETPDVATRLALVERELLSLLLNSSNIPDQFRQLFNALKQSENSFQLAKFCENNQIGMRKLERLYNKYVGISAISYNTLNRFHLSLNQLLSSNYTKLSDIAYSNGYFDQMHFVKDFKRFTGEPPRSFVHQNNSILSIGKLT